MDMCVLRPPNSQQFSDEVITDVVQRSRSSRNSFIDFDNSSSPDARYRQAKHSYAHTSDRVSYPTHMNGDRGASSMNSPPGRWQATSAQDPPLAGNKRKKERYQESVSMSPPASGGGRQTVPEKQDTQLATLASLVVSEQKRLRGLRRMRQIRYRKKKDSHALSLEEETGRLREEIEKLSQHLRAASVAVVANESVWNVAVEYFRFFRYGIRGQAPTQQGTGSCIYGRFLRSTMAPDVIFNSESGQEAMLTNWRSLSLWFKDIKLELEGLEKVGVGSVIATTTTSATITQKTLQCVFPRLRADETGVSVSSWLADKLLDQRIVMPGSTRFYWDRESGRVARIMSQSDMLTPMLRLLGTLGDVSVVFEGSPVTLDFQWNP